MLDAAKVRNALCYDPDTGIFVRREGQFAGRPAGTINNRGYVIIHFDGKLRGAHRLAWLYVHGRWPVEHIDHINGNPADNRLSNLREASHLQNCGNQRKPKHNTSGLKGVSYDRERRKWRADIFAKNNRRYLGRFDTAAEAHAVYVTEAQKVWGEFARAG